MPDFPLVLFEEVVFFPSAAVVRVVREPQQRSLRPARYSAFREIIRESPAGALLGCGANHASWK